MKKKLSYEIIVIGAGPAGSAAARWAAKGPGRVCLLERKEKAGTPVRCGEGVGLKGISKTIDIKDEWILTQIKKIKMVSPSGIEVDLEKIDKSYIVDRSLMDMDLKEQAVSSGAEYINNTSVERIVRNNHVYECTSGDFVYSAPCVIIADGVESKLARDLGWDTHLEMEDVETCAFCRIRHESIDPHTCIFHVGESKAPGGYLWVFPRGKGYANVGLGIQGTRSAPGRAVSLLKSFIDSNYPGSVIEGMHCGGVPAGRWTKPLVKEGAMIAGDAARQVNSLNGAGIAYSLIAGKKAGQTAAAAFSNGVFDESRLKEYERYWASGYGKQQINSYKLKNILMKDGSDVFLDSIADSLKNKKSGSLSYLKVFFRTFCHRPFTLIKVLKLFI